jgi:hypothetical protein
LNGEFALNDNELELDAQTIKLSRGRFLGEPAAPCGKKAIMCDYAGLADVFMARQMECYWKTVNPYQSRCFGQSDSIEMTFLSGGAKS